MTDPQVALFMLGLFIVFVFLGFPIAFTLMAMGIGFGYYAYFDADRMWRAYERLDETASWWDSTSLWVEGFFNNRIFDLFVNQTYTVMSNEVLTAIPLFLFMGYIVERANIVDKLFGTLNIASKNIPGSMGVAALITCALFATATGIVGAVVTLMGLLALPQMLKARYNPSFASGHHLRRRDARHPDPAVDHADRLCRGLGRVDRAALRRRAAARPDARRPVPHLRHGPRDPAALRRPPPRTGRGAGRAVPQARRHDHHLVPAAAPS